MVTVPEIPSWSSFQSRLGPALEVAITLVAGVAKSSSLFCQRLAEVGSRIGRKTPPRDREVSILKRVPAHLLTGNMRITG